MEPVLRISRHGALMITFNGADSVQTAAIRDIFQSTCGTGTIPAPLSFSRPGIQSEQSSAAPTLTGTVQQLQSFIHACVEKEVFPQATCKKIESLLDNHLRSDYKIICRGKVLELGTRTHIMGVLNVTPDSFSDGGLYSDPERALVHAGEMAAAGADIIDIGGESTRPGAQPLSPEEELRRIIPLIERLSGELAVPISVDTYKSSVAERALQAGASIVNDISGLRFSPDMAGLVADFNAAVIIMHIKGTPRDMQQNPSYEDVIARNPDLSGGGDGHCRKGGRGPGKDSDRSGHRLWQDARTQPYDTEPARRIPGTGQADRARHVAEEIYRRPSSVSPFPEQRIEGTAATVALGIERGASIVRVHDVARMTQVARMTDAILKQR